MERAKPVIDATFWLLLVLLVGLAVLAWQKGGSDLVSEGLASGLRLLVRYGLVIGVSFLAAGLAEKLMPTEGIRRWLGEEAGARGIVLASFAGALTPAGPFVSMPLAAVMLRAGAAHSAIAAFVVSWSLLAIHRFVAWEVPILGLRFAATRYAVCVVVPIVVGLALRWGARI
ncbi:MAG: hypothetical protein ACQGVK_14560 [Myxococcota bacterium]